MAFEVMEPQDELTRWLLSVDGDPPVRYILTACGVEYPRMVGNKFRLGAAVLVAGELDDLLPGKMRVYRVLDWFGARGTLDIGAKVGEWARRLKRGDSPWEQVSVIAPSQPSVERAEMLEAHPTLMCRSWRREWDDHDYCQSVVKDRANRPSCNAGALNYESELPAARAALGRAMADLDEAYRYCYAAKFESIEVVPAVGGGSRGIAGY